MPRGRHRHSPPLHRLLPPSAIAGVSLVCAFGPWLFREPAVLRVVAAVAAATAVVGAAVMRRWDAQAGRQVADLARARAGDEWRHEERVAELEADLEESRELRVKMEQKLRAKRTELAGLRNEHAALLRRYATAETERATALEGRRLLEIEAAPAPETDEADLDMDDAEAVAAPDDVDSEAEAEAEADLDVDSETDEEEPAVPAVFSPAGSQLFLRAKAALVRFDDDKGPAPKPSVDVDGQDEKDDQEDQEDPDDDPEGARAAERVGAARELTEAKATDAEAEAEAEADSESGAEDETEIDAEADTVAAADADAEVDVDADADAEGDVVPEGEVPGKPEAVDAREHAAAGSAVAKPAKSAQPSGHFTVPTAVAVVPAAPARRPLVEGGFDFFGTQKGSGAAVLDAVHNEDLADVVGQEALAVHKAESEAQFKPADERSRGVGQVIDLTAHDETEQINLHRLRSAAS
ncbi:hypothetical protein [Streptomyces sp. NPDC005423]|uniref:hypothetical protein n=1 Tax=Streptomyces sp. NPDC005423 TaxID=3155343 RepID=UPI0033BE32A0